MRPITCSDCFALSRRYKDYGQVVTINPTNEQLDALVASGQAFPFGPPCHNNADNPCSVYTILDIRKANLGDFNLDTLDLSADYDIDTSFGALNFGASAVYTLNREQRSSESQPFKSVLDANFSRLRVRTSAALQTGDLLSQVVWSHRAGYKLDPEVGFDPQSDVEAFDVFNLYFRYDANGDRILKDVTLTLNVDNVLDTEPPEFRAPAINGIGGFTNGGTLGRVIQLGVSKKF